MSDPFACPDPIAERRYAYAKAAAEDGDWRAAADLFEQTLELAPRWAPASFALGEAREKLGDRAGAAGAFRACLDADRPDAQGAAARLSLLGEGEPATTLPAAYVARLFDDYAPRFAAHLVGKLAYRAPEIIVAALDAAAPGRRFREAIDLGCGTGLMGMALHGRVGRVTGVDLAPRMIAEARASSAYDALDVGDALPFLSARAAQSCDLIVAADVLVYLGDLTPLFAAAARALEPGGLLAFTVETFDGAHFRLRETMRFAHSRSHVEAGAAAANLRPLFAEDAAPRREAGVEVPGRVYVLARA